MTERRDGWEKLAALTASLASDDLAHALRRESDIPPDPVERPALEPQLKDPDPSGPPLADGQHG